MDYLQMMEQTTVTKDIEGKNILIYGGNNLGKSKQFANIGREAAYIPIESSATNAIGGANRLPISDYAQWKTFVMTMHKSKQKLLKIETRIDGYQSKIDDLQFDLEEATKKSAIEKLEKSIKAEQRKLDRQAERREKNKFYKLSSKIKYLILDGITALDKSAEEYVVDQAEVLELGDGDHGALYKRFENEFYRTLMKYLNLGFTNVFIAHEGRRKVGGTKKDPIYQIYPKGTLTRVVKPIIDHCDIIGYLTPNGIDKEGKIIHSSAHFYECDEFFARTKFEKMDVYIEDFTYENLIQTIAEGVEREFGDQEVVVDFDEQKRRANKRVDTRSTEEIKDEILDLANLIYAYDKFDREGSNMSKYFDITQEFLGTDCSVVDASDQQKSHLMSIESQVEDLFEDLELTDDEIEDLRVALDKLEEEEQEEE